MLKSQVSVHFYYVGPMSSEKMETSISYNTSPIAISSSVDASRSLSERRSETGEDAHDEDERDAEDAVSETSEHNDQGEKVLAASPSAATSETQPDERAAIAATWDLRDEVIPKYKENYVVPNKPGHIPIVVISSLRPDYLNQVLDAIEPHNQNPNTPDWIVRSPKYVFAHKNDATHIDNRWNETQAIARKHNCTLVTFEGTPTGVRDIGCSFVLFLFWMDAHSDSS